MIKIFDTWNHRVLFVDDSHSMQTALQNAVKSGTALSAADLREQVFNDLDLASVSKWCCPIMRFAKFTRAHCTNVNWHRAELQSADFFHSVLINCNFRGCDLSGADFRSSTIESCDFSNTRLDKTRFDHQILMWLMLRQPHVDWSQAHSDR